jgi:2-polyprenyl-3-methyl-5-hydroxy-6-metoxy-1,4-benzoquinol methylase
MTKTTSGGICRVSGRPLVALTDFGDQPLGNGFLSPEQYGDEYFFRMVAGFCPESLMYQLVDQPNPEKMFHGDYAFFSSTSRFMAKHFKDFASQIIGTRYVDGPDPFVVELGCNDGIMLKNFAEAGIRHLGVEPSRNVAEVANSKGVRTISEFFSAELARRIVAEDGQADAFLAANVMCHIPDIKGVAEGIALLLKPTGIAMFEDPYLGDIIQKTSYDQIYDEHVFLFSAHSVQKLFALYDLELIDLLPQETHGGSMRYVLAHKGSYPVGEAVERILQQERDLGLHKAGTFERFGENVAKSKSDLLALLRDIKAQGKSIVGYAATSKSTTIFNYCGIGPELIDYICDTTPMKQGKFSPGVHIPVVASEEFKANPPDYAFLLAWNHSREIMANEHWFAEAGGKWITHVPSVRVIE